MKIIVLWNMIASVVGANVSKGHATSFFRVEYLEDDGRIFVRALPPINHS